jgi:hypothetical protein
MHLDSRPTICRIISVLATDTLTVIAVWQYFARAMFFTFRGLSTLWTASTPSPLILIARLQAP